MQLSILSNKLFAIATINFRRSSGHQQAKHGRPLSGNLKTWSFSHNLSCTPTLRFMIVNYDHNPCMIMIYDLWSPIMIASMIASMIANFYDVHLWSASMIDNYDRHLWWPSMIFIYDCHLWSPSMINIWDHHLWSTSRIFIYDRHIKGVPGNFSQN